MSWSGGNSCILRVWLQVVTKTGKVILKNSKFFIKSLIFCRKSGFQGELRSFRDYLLILFRQNLNLKCFSVTLAGWRIFVGRSVGPESELQEGSKTIPYNTHPDSVVHKCCEKITLLTNKITFLEHRPKIGLKLTPNIILVSYIILDHFSKNDPCQTYRNRLRIVMSYHTSMYRCRDDFQLRVFCLFWWVLQDC